MNGRKLKLLKAALVACAFVSGVIVAGAQADAMTAGMALAKSGASVRSNVIEIKRRQRRGRPLYLPIAPNYLAYDYPYYYRRGFYPEHVGPGYIYYGYPYFYRKRYSRRCSHRYWRCLANARGLRHKRRACRCR